MIKQILVIDDDAEVLSFLGEMLEKAGYEVEVAPDGRMGLYIAHEQTFDVIITDIIMPEKEGIEVILGIREQNPEAKIIAISGGGRIDADVYLDMADRLGVVKTLRKPFGRRELLDVLKELD